MRNALAGIIICLLGLTLPAQEEQGSLRILILGPTGFGDLLLVEGFESWRIDAPTAAGELVETIVHSSELPRLQGLTAGLPFLITERSRPFREIQNERQKALGTDLPDPGYHTLDEIRQELADMESNFPQYAKVYDFQSRYGSPLTHLGESTPLLRISDNPTVDEDEPNIMLFTNNHCRELNTIEVSLFVADKLLAGQGSDATLTDLVTNNQIWIVPTMNPDGLNYVWNVDNMWRKNRRDNLDGNFGVDLNRNYPFFWSLCGSSSSTSSNVYHGPGSASEPESQAMLAFVLAEGLERMLDVHSSGRDLRTPFNSLVRPNLPFGVTSFYNPMHLAFAAAMNYVPNTSCCCGTHMEWHQNVNGSMAFLIEMGTAFQPPIAETQAELQQMWPGILLFLTKAAPMRGRVLSLRNLEPLAATITVAGEVFQDGQTIRALGRNGRYSLWMGPGSYDVTFAAPGHHPLTVPATLVDGVTFGRDVALEPIAAATTLTAIGSPVIGTTVDLIVDSLDDAGKLYFVPASSAETPPIALLDREIPLALTPLLGRVTSLPGIFVDAVGNLDGSGQATAQFVIPNETDLIGLELWFCALTIDFEYLLGIKGISENVKLVLSN